MKRLALTCAAIFFVASAPACGGDGGGEGGGAVDGGGGGGADGAPGSAADCSGDGDRLILEGAFTLNTPNIGPATLSGKVIGVAGAASGDLVTFAVRNAIEDDLDSVGTTDVSEKNLKYLRQPDGVDCDSNPDQCEGFFAAGGSYTVTEVSPRYRAQFELTDLSERLGNEEGDPIAGTVTGCLNMAGQ